MDSFILFPALYDEIPSPLSLVIKVWRENASVLPGDLHENLELVIPKGYIPKGGISVWLAHVYVCLEWEEVERFAWIWTIAPYIALWKVWIFCILSGLRVVPIYEEKFSNLIRVLLRHINGPLQVYEYPFYSR